MTATEVKALTDRELDVLIAEKVMGEPMPPKPSEDDGELAMIGDGRKSDGGNWRVCIGYESRDIPYWVPQGFSTDRNAAALVLERIGELGLASQWCGIFMQHQWEKSSAFVWIAATATSRQLMEAALLAWEESR